jgi:hypothetical protein
VPHSVHERRHLIEEDVLVCLDVDDPVVGGDEGADRVRQPGRPPSQVTVELLEQRRPAAGLPPVFVRRLVELRDVHVAQGPSGAPGDDVERRVETIGHGASRPVVRATEHRSSEARTAVPLLADDGGGDALRTGPFEHGG